MPRSGGNMPRARVLVSDKLSEAGLRALKDSPHLDVDYRPGLSPEELRKAIAEAEGLVIRSGTKVSSDILEAAPKLRVIGRAGIGVDNVDVPAASKRGIIVMNTPTGNAVTTAEHAISLLFSLARRIPQATASMKAGKWEKSRFQGREMSGKTLGILGLGNIGRIVANRAAGLSMRVIAFDPVVSSEKAASLGVELVDLDTFFRRADCITAHAPLTSETKGIINEAAFEKMKPGVLIVNAARGGIVDELALAKAVESGKVGGAAIDVFEKEPPAADHPLLKLDAVICTPHLGASTSEAQERVAVEIGQQVAAYLTDGRVQNAINVPSLGAEAAERLGPYLKAARKAGLLLGQLGSVDPKEFRVTCTGVAGEFGVRPIAHAALAGLLERHVEAPMNEVRAPYEAKERGIAVIEVRREADSGFASAIEVEVTGSKGKHCATVTVGPNSEARLVKIDGFLLDALLEGTTLVMRNDDRPGFIGAVGTLLGTKNINVSRMQVGLDAASSEAISLWNIDSSLSDEVLLDMQKLSNLRSVTCVELD